MVNNTLSAVLLAMLVCTYISTNLLVATKDEGSISNVFSSVRDIQGLRRRNLKKAKGPKKTK
jgi:hypothetical protein